MSNSNHPAAWDEQQLVENCEMRRTRRSGPGGQHRNKVETAVVITFLPAGIRAEANERRSQDENRREAIFRLRVKLALGLRNSVAEAQVPTARWQSRLKDKRVVISPNHHDFPALLAETLDMIYAQEMDIVAAADRLLCTSSQLCRLLRHEPAALQQVNIEREKRGLRRLA